MTPRLGVAILTGIEYFPHSQESVRGHAAGHTQDCCVTEPAQRHFAQLFLHLTGGQGSPGTILKPLSTSCRFDVWPYLEQFALEAGGEIRKELGGHKPDLIIGNYSDGNLVATLLAYYMNVTQCTIGDSCSSFLLPMKMTQQAFGVEVLGVLGFLTFQVASFWLSAAPHVILPPAMLPSATCVHTCFTLSSQQVYQMHSFQESSPQSGLSK